MGDRSTRRAFMAGRIVTAIKLHYGIDRSGVDQWCLSFFKKKLIELSREELTLAYRAAVVMHDVRTPLGYRDGIVHAYNRRDLPLQHLSSRLWRLYRVRELEQLEPKQLLEFYRAVVVDARFTKEEISEMHEASFRNKSTSVNERGLSTQLSYVLYFALLAVGILLFSLIGFSPSFEAYKNWLTTPSLVSQMLMAIGMSGMTGLILTHAHVTTSSELYDWLAKAKDGRFLRWNMGGAILYVFGVAFQARYPEVSKIDTLRLLLAIVVLTGALAMVAGMVGNIVLGFRATLKRT